MMNRREFLGAAAAAQITMSATAQSLINAAAPLTKGERFNESQEFFDAATGRPSRRLTSKRRWNQTPTYTKNACFSADSRSLVLATEDEAGNSAILKCDVETGEMFVVATSDEVKGTPGKPNINGNNLAINQAGNWVAANVKGSIRLWDLKTLEQRIVYTCNEDVVYLGHPIGSVDGKLVFFTVQKSDPSNIIGDRGTGRTLFPTFNGASTDFMEANLATGKVRVIHHDDRAGCNHLVACPADPDLLLIDRDWPLDIRASTSRDWLLNYKTGKLTEIRPLDSCRFVLHSNFNGPGDRVYYHGPSSKGGQYFGVADLEGKIVWESWVPQNFYGHMSTHPQWDALISDGIFSDAYVCAVFYKELDSTGAPRLQILAKHSTDWDHKYGQYSHPHCHVSPDGRWLTYNRGGSKGVEGGAGDGCGLCRNGIAPIAPGDGRTDVYLVRIG